MYMRAFVQILALTFALLGPAGTVHAQPGYPTKAVRFIVGFPPGGANDILARLVGARLQESLGQPFLVENRPGANAIVATEFVAKSAPDGYTLLIGASGAMAFNPGLYEKLPYDSMKDFAPVTTIGSFPLVVAVHPSVEAKTMQELAALARAKPGALNYGAGSTPFQLAAELFKLRTGADIRHVPYKGSGPTTQALLANEVQLTFLDSPPLVPHIRAGRLRGLAVTSPRRAAVLPDLPTAAESGLADFEVVLWTSVFAPAGTPEAIVRRLHAEIARTLQLAEVRERMLGLGIDPVGNTPEELAAMLRADIEKWGRVARSAGIKANP